ncbi:phage terminase large subunit-like protein [Aneurinibacillus soli]|uniref:Phage Terminase n=1 Tax=Aneurinibacillus soli TaxID=1500254 RepID=A0A0U4WFW5_9BACL|nr:terminase large subunit [Aneurinibacillus soli]PYE63444.1 phage terminase large subunit-like protein [Aneurinibacillus soli]BAU27624.1 Phage Terminase [Aneurinibacillus soli]
MTTISITSSPKEIEKWYRKWHEKQVKKRHILNDFSPKLLTTWYTERVINGEIVAGKKVVQACQRHLNDLERQGTEDFPYIFDEDRAHRPIKFIEQYCRPSKGDYQKLVLQPWQHFTIGSLYGWVHKDTGVRRFREGLIFIGRKNGKTTKISGLSLYSLSKDNERGAKVYVLANTKQQAGELFNESRAMVQKSPSLRKRVRENQKGIYFDKTFSSIEARASDSEKLDGLNTHLGIFDEIHEFKDFKLINVIKRSWSARKQPMVVYITTAGYQLDGPLIEYYEIAADVLNGALEQERKFYFMAELDDENEIENPAMWIKANPNVGVTLNLPELVQDFNTDRHVPQEYNDWVTKQFNLFVDNSEQSFLSFEVLKRNDSVIDEKLLEGKGCIGSFDLSDSEDFTSACLEFPLDDGRVFVLSHTWIPEAKVKKENENIPYRVYEKEGLLTIIPGEYVKKEYIFDWFVEKSERFPIENIMYDPAKAFGLVESLKAHGFECEVVRQGFLTLGPALDNAKELFLDGKVVFNNNRLFRWYINNVKLVEDRNRNKMPTKQGRYRKIDGFAAFLNAHTVVMKKLAVPTASGNVDFVSIKDLLRG